MRRAVVYGLVLFVAFSIASVITALMDGRIHGHPGEMLGFALSHPVLPAIAAVLAAIVWYRLQRRSGARR
ncbi:hypothetical protein [Nocardia concava]|uniref:hypothetical protein n=1 Tax=Nocardia concava TaxID=257281 RepID=UPI0012FBEABD|nr:hypothetical protein [Nocardia concava]